MNPFFDVAYYFDDETGKSSFEDWFKKLDNTEKNKINQRLDRIIYTGNFGDFKPLATNLYELRFKAGIRIYYTLHHKTIVLLLVGGKKDTQEQDIAKTKILANNVKD